MSKASIAATLSVPAIILLIGLAVAGLRVVPEGHMGVKTVGADAVSQRGPGWTWVIPVYEDINTLSFRTETYTMSSTTSSQKVEQRVDIDDSISVKTNEGLNSQMDISVRYRMNNDSALNVYTDLGNEKAIMKKLVRPTAREEIRTAASRFTINQIYAENRSDFRQAVEDDIRNDFDDYGFELLKVQIRDIHLPDRVEAAIEEKEAVEQSIEKKQKEVEREKLEKERKIIQAEGDAKQNEILDRSLTQNVLVNRYIDALGSGDVKVAYIPLGDNGGPTFVENLNNASSVTN